MIDHKYKILAVNPCTGNIHTEEDSVLFCVSDKHLAGTISDYIARLKNDIEVSPENVESATLLLGRVREKQMKDGVKSPDINSCEIDRCIGGKV